MRDNKTPRWLDWARETQSLSQTGYHYAENEYQRQRNRCLIGVYDANRMAPLEVFHAYKLVFLCEIISGNARPSGETSQVRFLGLDEIPTMLSGERTKLNHIQDAFSFYSNQDKVIIFD